MNPNQNQDKHKLAHLPGIAIFFAFALWWPLGVILLVLRKMDQKAEQQELEQQAQGQPAYWQPQQDYGDLENDFAARRRRNARAAQPVQQAQPSRTNQGRAPVGAEIYDVPTADMERANTRQKRLTVICCIAGAILALVGLSNLGEAFDFIRWLGFKFDVIWDYLLPGIAQLVGGGGMLFASFSLRRARKLEELIDRVVGGQDHLSIKEICAAVGVDRKKGRKAVQDAIDHGYFGADAYIDNRTDTLVVRGPAPEPEPEPVSRSTPIPTPAEEEADGPVDVYEDMLRKLRAANRAIPGREMTSKIDRLEQLSARIFEIAQRSPEKAPQLRRFMDYYLPTALKLLNTYADLEKQAVQGRNSQEARANIEHAMDLLVTAFENQLDKLYASDALDVSSDIAALQSMLNLDGLTGQDDFSSSAAPAAPDPPFSKF